MVCPSLELTKDMIGAHSHFLNLTKGQVWGRDVTFHIGMLSSLGVV